MAQKYQVLARRYRPQRFSELVGQEAVLQTLKNAIRRESLAHAYLFSGSRGVGKTTLARLFAKALNCTSLQPDSEPCNSCPSCLDILSGQSLDVIEIDGASNRGIDDIRQINETVAFAPSHGKYKIYIIDEVHMLTKEAFNALLKTLEEPPERAKFFFATTEPHKVLPTIISRCQRFDLGRLLPAQIIDKLESIARDLNRTVDAEAINLLAQYADGLRDAESLFDQILCFSDGEISAADVRNALGLVPQDLFFALDKAFSEQRFSYAFELVDELFQSGKDLAHFLEQLIEHYRHITVAKTRGATALGLTPALGSRYAASAALYSQPQCLAILDLLLKAESISSRSTSPRVSLELTLLQILRTKNRIPIEALVRKLSELEESLKNSQTSFPTAPSVPEMQVPEPLAETPVAASTFVPETQAPVAPFRTARAPETQAPEPIAETPITPPVIVPVPMSEAQAPVAPFRTVLVPETQAHEPIAETPVTPLLIVPVPVPEAQAPVAPPFIVPAPVPETRAHELIAKAPIVPPLIVPAPVPQTPAPEPALELKAVPFSSRRTIEQPKPIAPSPPKIDPSVPIAPSKHPSHYATLMRFAAVELEGTIKN